MRQAKGRGWKNRSDKGYDVGFDIPGSKTLHHHGLLIWGLFSKRKTTVPFPGERLVEEGVMWSPMIWNDMEVHIWHIYQHL